MNKSEAIKAIEEGETVSHEYFSDDEFIKLLDANFYQDENGYHLLKSEFWEYRTSPSFDEGWRIIPQQK